MFRSLGKDGLVKEVARFRSGEYYNKATAGRLAISETGAIGPNEQRLGKTFVDFIPGFTKSNDAYASFTQTLRSAMFEDKARKLEAPKIDWEATIKNRRLTKTEGGDLSLDEYKALAEYVNTVTGAGRGKMADALNQFRFFAGGYTVSRFQTAVGQPIVKALIRRDAKLAKEVIKDYGKLVGFASGYYLTMTAMGFQVEGDIRSSNFMQVKKDGRWIDPFAGLFKPLTLIARMTMGSKDEKTGKIEAASPENVLGFFIAGKQEPVGRTVLSAVKGQNFGKNTSVASPEGIANLAKGLYMPIFVEQAIETMNDKRMTDEQKVALVIAQAFGVQSDKVDKPKIDKRIAKPLADVVAPAAREIGKVQSETVNRLRSLSQRK